MQINSFKPSIPDSSKIGIPKSFFTTVKEQYLEYRDRGFFNESKNDQVIIYDVTLNGQVHTGFICCIDSKEITNGNVIRHENTLKEKEVMMMKLIKERQANIKPILLTIPNSEKIDKWIKSNRHSNTITYAYGKSETHTMTPITGKKAIKEIVSLFDKEVPKAYIADGHHRCFSIDYLIEKDPIKYSQVLVVFFPFSNLMIKPYNRIVEFDDKMSSSTLVEILKPFVKVVQVKNFKQSNTRKEFYVFIDTKWFKCTWKKDLLQRIDGGSLDLFNHHILNDGFYRYGHTTHYIQGDTEPKQVVKTVNKLKNSAGFFFAPLTYDRLITILDRGNLVVPKSTYFEPRMRNGVVVQNL